MSDCLPTVIHRTCADLVVQRARLLAEVGVGYEELRDRAERWLLTMDELEVWWTIEGIDYLLGEGG